MKFKKFIILFVFSQILSCVTEKKDGLQDRYLVIPGKSAEGYTIGDYISDVKSLIRFVDKKQFSDIFNVDILSGLEFDSVVYTADSHALFLKDQAIVGIAGFKINKRVTSDAVLLTKGIDNFILNYGNDGLKIISSGRHKAYIYKDCGIAVFDDNNDNSIDMYLVFMVYHINGQ